MIVGSTVLASIGIICLSVSFYYVLAILRELWRNEDIALARIFLSEAVHRSFIMLAAGAAILSLCMSLAVIGTMAEPPLSLLTEAPTIGAIAVSGAFLIFTRTLAQVLVERADHG